MLVAAASIGEISQPTASTMKMLAGYANNKGAMSNDNLDV